MHVILVTQYFTPFLPCQMDLGNAGCQFRQKLGRTSGILVIDLVYKYIATQ